MMNVRITVRHFAVLAAFVSAAALTACGGGGSGSTIPSAGGASTSHTGAKSPQGKMTAFIPAATSPGTNSGTRKPAYIDSSAPNSALVISVTPSDPAEVAQWQTLYGAAGFTICYNIFTAGAINTANPNVVVTAVPGGYNVSFPFPSPPGQDSFLVTQYSGQCSPSNPYAAPPPPAGGNGSGILAQALPLNVTIAAGASNNFNIQLAACSANPTGVGGFGANQNVCPVPNPGGIPVGGQTPSLGGFVSAVYLAGAAPAPALAASIPLPIAEPIREQGAFVAAANNIGIPIPVVALDATGYPVPYTAGVPGTNPPSSGALPKAGDSIVLTHTEVGATPAHAQLVMIDARDGDIIQNEAAAPITLTAVNGIAAADITYGNAHGHANPATDANDPYVISLSYDGSAATQLTSVSVLLNATLNGAAIPQQTLTIKPQATIFSAVAPASAPANGYADAAGAYTAAADVINTLGAAGLGAAGQGIWVSDGASLAQVGGAHYAVAGATTLTGIALDAFTGSAPAIAQQIVAVDNSTAGLTGQTSPPANSGLFLFDPVLHTNKPVAIQDITTGNYVQLAHPVGVAYQPGGYIYVATANSVIALDPQANGAGGLATTNTGSQYLAEEIGTVSTTGLNFGTATGIGMIATASGITLADTGNNRIVSVAVTPSSPLAGSQTVVASGAPFVGLAQNGATLVATATSGQIYSIAGGTATSFGLATGSVADGPIGILGPPASGQFSYLVQGNAGNFYNSAPSKATPYTILPFASGGPVFAAAAQTAIAGAPLKYAADTSNAKITASAAGSTGAPYGIVFVSAASITTPNAALTKDAYIFADSGNIRTLVP